MGDRMDKVINGFTNYLVRIERDNNSRELSWKHCYRTFRNIMKKVNLSDDDYDYLSLHLAFYLASWGMYRGSSFLQKKDYKVHIGAIKILLKYKYLAEVESEKLMESETIEHIMQLEADLTDYYEKIRKETLNFEVSAKVSRILITKIILGTLGCVPAYDEFFILGLKELDFKHRSFGKKSISELALFYKDKKDLFNNVQNNLDVCNPSYPPMKFLDMAIWQIGWEKNEDEKRNKRS